MMKARPLFALPAIMLLAPGTAWASGRDARIEASARKSYNFRVHLKGDSIQVKAVGGVVTLSGTVADDNHRRLAEETLLDTPGVKSVVNLLALEGSAPGETSDAWLTAKVKAALLYQRNVDAAATHVETREGVVTLSGEAANAAQKDLAEDIARNVEGVKRVENSLRVATHPPGRRRLTERIDDASVTAQVKASLLFHRSTRLLSTRVKTHRGVVTLRGEARNPAEKELVSRIASGIHGVLRVENRMTVAE